MQAREARWAPGRSALGGLAWLAGALAWIAASVVGAFLALLVATALVVMSFMGLVVLALAGVGARARRAMRQSREPGVIEARNIGGHSWVAYGWDTHR